MCHSLVMTALSRQVTEKVAKEGYTDAYTRMQQSLSQASTTTDQIVAITTYLQSKPSVNKLSVACGVICTLSLLIFIITWSLVRFYIPLSAFKLQQFLPSSYNSLVLS